MISNFVVNMCRYYLTALRTLNSNRKSGIVCISSISLLSYDYSLWLLLWNNYNLFRLSRLAIYRLPVNRLLSSLVRLLVVPLVRLSIHLILLFIPRLALVSIGLLAIGLLAIGLLAIGLLTVVLLRRCLLILSLLCLHV